MRTRLLAGTCALAAALPIVYLQGQQPTVVPPPPAFAPAPGVKDPASFRDVVKKVVPAVVNVEVTLAKKTADDPGFGSGVLIDPAGVVLTNFHVVEGAVSAEVQLQDGRKFTSTDIRRDAKSDLAIVILKPDAALPALDLGDSDQMEVGDRVLAVGAPFGLRGSVTHGIVSAKSRTNLKLNAYEDFLQTDAPINPGNSGGPLVNLDGQIIGINSAIKTKTGGFQGVGLAISSNMARDIVRQLRTTGVVRRGYLGVSLGELDAATAAKAGLKTGAGVVVGKVAANGPGAKAGLQVGDIITAVAGTPVTDANALPRVVSRLPLGEKAEVAFQRGGKAFVANVVVEEQPDDYLANPALAKGDPRGGLAVAELGLTAADLTAQAAAQLGYPKGTAGVQIVSVEAGSPAATAGLLRNQVIVKVDKTPTPTAKALGEALAAADREKGSVITLLRPSGELAYAILRVK